MSVVVPAVLLGAAVVVLLLAPGGARLARVTGSGRAGGLGGAPSGGRSVLMAAPEPRLVAGGAALLGLALSGPAAAGLLAVLALVGLRGRGRRRTRCARAAERHRALEACAALRSELRAGRSPAEALAVAAVAAGGTSRDPPASALADALHEATAASRWGGDVPAALERHVARSAAPELLRGLAACWQVCTGSGAGLAAAVERLELGLRTAQLQRDAVEAELAGPRATAGLLALLPLAGTALSAGLGARPVHVLLHTPLGAVCLVVGVALDLAGVWWTGRLVVGAGGER